MIRNSCNRWPVHLIVLSLLVAALTPPAARAEDFQRVYDDRWKVTLGYYLSRFDTEVKLKSTAVPVGIVVDMEDDLGLDKDYDDWRGQVVWRPGRRHRILLDYYRFDRSSFRTVDQTIEIGEEIIDINAEVDTKVTANLVELAYMYSLIQDEKFELAGVIGLHIVDWQSKFDARNPDDSTVNEIAELTAPLPVFGIDVSYLVTPRFVLLWRSEFFAINIGDYGGSLTNTALGLEYYIWKNVGLGLAYNQFSIDVSVDDDRLLGELDYVYKGLIGYVTTRF